MLCRKVSVKSSRGSVPVHLNVYDLTSINGYAYWLGLGVYHSGVEVHGVEYAFGAHAYPTSGILEGEPKQYNGFTFRKSVLIGWTDLTPPEIKIIMDQFAVKYRGDSYNLVSKNCNHFCNDACIKLTGNPIPSWVNRLARIGFLCNCIIPTTLNSTKVRSQKMKDKDCEMEKKKLKSYSCRFTNSSSSNTSSSSLCSPPPVTDVGGSRSSLPPSLPLV